MTRAQRDALRSRVDAKIAAVKAGTAVTGDLIAVVDPNELSVLLARLDTAERLLGEAADFIETVVFKSGTPAVPLDICDRVGTFLAAKE